MDSKKLEKAEQLLQKKQDKRQDGSNDVAAGNKAKCYKGANAEATASQVSFWTPSRSAVFATLSISCSDHLRFSGDFQVLSKKDDDANSTSNQSKDIKIENFDIAFGEKVFKKESAPICMIPKNWARLYIHAAPVVFVVHCGRA